MDKTPSYAWENPRKVMENEISDSTSPVITHTSTFSRKVMDNEISESSSPGFTRTSTVFSLSISFLETVDVRVKTGGDVLDISLSISFLETVDVRVKTGEDDSDISLSISFLETVDVRVNTGEDDSDISLSITFLETVRSEGKKWTMTYSDRLQLVLVIAHVI
jgi:hypothetical protein